MATTSLHSVSISGPAHKSIVGRFFDWAAGQDAEYHVAWVGISVMGMAGCIFPIAMSAILLNGANFGLIMAASVAFALVVVTNLAALPTRYTIPFFVLGILIDVVAIGLSFVI